jgi:hypothetical protein
MKTGRFFRNRPNSVLRTGMECLYHLLKKGEIMSEPIMSENLQAAIDRLRPELAKLLGADYTAFVDQLDALLASGTGSQILDLCEKYPSVDKYLQDILNQQDEEDANRQGFGLYGDSPSAGDAQKRTLPRYRCEAGLHVVSADHVEERDPAGNALCPQHHVPMVKIVEMGNKSGQK